jgi:hypothetical protein
MNSLNRLITEKNSIIGNANHMPTATSTYGIIADYINNKSYVND